MADAAPEPTKDEKGRKFINKAELAKHKDRKNAWISIHNKIYDVAGYLDDHPGGEEVLMDRAGQDATEDFEDVGHSKDARQMLEKFEKGELPPSERKAERSESSSEGGGGGMMMAIPVLLVALAAGYYFYTQSQ